MNEEENQNQNEQKPEENQKDKGFEGFVGIALRTGRKGIYEQLECQLLINANTAHDSLLKIQNICQAAYLSKKKSKIDMTIIEVTALVSRSFINTLENYSRHKDNSMISVTWIFLETEENWTKYIAPWQRIDLHYYPIETSYRRHKHPFQQSVYPRDREEDQEWLDYLEDLRKEVTQKISKMPTHRNFFEKTGALAHESFYALRGEFEEWAMIKLESIVAVISEEINPETFKDVLKILSERGKREGEDLENESPLG